MPNSTQPKVLIVGAGLGGLCLGILLEHAGVEFEIFEQASIFKPIGKPLWNVQRTSGEERETDRDGWAKQESYNCRTTQLLI